MVTRIAGAFVAPAYVLSTLVLVFGLAVWTPAVAQERGTATEAVTLYESPPQRMILFPYVVLLSGEVDTLDAGTQFVILDDEERNDFFRQPSRWLHVRTADGQQGWTDDENVVIDASPSPSVAPPPHRTPEPN